MNLGFSGSRNGMNVFQRYWFERLLLKLKPEVFHHGACDGADFQAVCIVRQKSEAYIYAHPPKNPQYLSVDSTNHSQVIFPPKDYLVRNDDIVANCDLLIATPSPESRGTRYTIQKARDTRKPVIVIELDSVRGYGV
jgi:hypothetical protein